MQNAGGCPNSFCTIWRSSASSLPPHNPSMIPSAADKYDAVNSLDFLRLCHFAFTTSCSGTTSSSATDTAQETSRLSASSFEWKRLGSNSFPANHPNNGEVINCRPLYISSLKAHASASQIN